MIENVGHFEDFYFVIKVVEISIFYLLLCYYYYCEDIESDKIYL